MLKFDRIKQYADILSKGLMQEMAPEIAAGILLELLGTWQLNTLAIIGHVQTNRSLWAKLSDHDRERLVQAMLRIGDVRWLTSEWFIKTIKHDYPAVASLILGWPEAQTWLEDQVDDLKRQARDANLTK